MNKKDLNIWLAENEINQIELAKEFKINPATITRYKWNNRFPRIFELALAGLKLQLKGDDNENN